MAKEKTGVCPGCSRHCTAGHAHCKYGQKYFEKQQRAQGAQPDAGQNKEGGKRRKKWEKHVAQDGLAWRFLMAAGQSKRALRSKKLTEQTWLAALNETEQAQLDALLQKLAQALK